MKREKEIELIKGYLKELNFDYKNKDLFHQLTDRSQIAIINKIDELENRLEELENYFKD